MAIERRPRIRCRVPCELEHGGRRLTAQLVVLSEGGFGIETASSIAVGDPVRVRILPHRRDRAVELTALAWNARRRGATRWVVGFVVSEPPIAFSKLVAELLTREQRLRPISSRFVSARRTSEAGAGTAPTRVRTSQGGLHLVESPATSCDLPRPKAPFPPPKPDPEECLPSFRVRVKQTAGPRSRNVELRARSSTDAAQRALDDLGRDWEILEVIQLAVAPA